MKSVARRSKPTVDRAARDGKITSQRFEQLLAKHRKGWATAQLERFHLGDAEALRHYVRWFRIHYPAPTDLSPSNDNFFGVKLLNY